MKKAFTLIELMIVIAIIAIIAAIAIPNLIEARKSANESSAIGSLRSITSAQAIYVERSQTLTYGTLVNLGTASLIDQVLSAGTKSGYNLLVGVPGGAIASYQFTGTARPLTANSGTRYFFVDQSGVIRFNNTTTATVASSVLGGNK